MDGPGAHPLVCWIFFNVYSLVCVCVCVRERERARERERERENEWGRDKERGDRGS